MAATQTLAQIPQPDNWGKITITLKPRHGVIALYGYGIKAFVDRGHLNIEDGICAERRKTRLPRVGHGLKRLVIVGSDGMISLAAIRWLADQDAAFVMLDRDGSVLATTGPVRSSDARLRRAQALANDSGVAMKISRELISQKLAAQERVAREKLLDDATAEVISKCRAALEDALTIDRIRLLEAKGAAAYWSIWKTLPVNFPKKDLPRVPAHWLSFGARVSPISGSQRLAANPPNAILNYLYALLESEARLAAAALGLDPGLGFLHVDTPARDSLACDLMEPVRPLVDAYLIDWITREPLQRSWFFEKPDGNCRLMASLTEKLSETAQTWARAVSPYAEWVAQTLWTRRPGSASEHRLATRLTQRHKREAKDQPSLPKAKLIPRPEKVCRDCGAKINPGTRYCAQCSLELAKEQFADAAKSGRVAAQSAEAQRRRSATQARQMAGRQGWVASRHPAWLDSETYERRIQPRLAELTCAALASATGVSLPYAGDIRAGKRRPHPRHWQTLAQLVGVSPAC